MITVQDKYRYPNEWAELNPEQYLLVIRLMLEFMNGKLSAQEVRVAYFLHVAGINPKAIMKRNRERFHENVYRITRTLNFMFRYEYPDGALSEITPNLRKALEKSLPNDLPDQPELQYVKKLKRRTLPDFVFSKNLLPEIKIKNKKYTGYTFELCNDILNTTLTAAQYVDANLLYGQYLETRDTTYLDLLIATLYCPKQYKETAAITFAKTTKHIENEVKQAVFVCFQAIQTFLSTQTKYALLWNRKPTTANNKFSLGLTDCIYSLSSAGYGSLPEVSNLPLTAFLDLMLKNIIDAVKSMNELNLKKNEIAEKTGLTISQINKII